MTDALKCPACGRRNPAAAKFCINCGKRLPQGASSHDEKQVVPELSVGQGRTDGTDTRSGPHGPVNKRAANAQESPPAAGASIPRRPSNRCCAGPQTQASRTREEI